AVVKHQQVGGRGRGVLRWHENPVAPDGVGDDLAFQFEWTFEFSARHPLFWIRLGRQGIGAGFAIGGGGFRRGLRAASCTKNEETAEEGDAGYHKRMGG